MLVGLRSKTSLVIVHPDAAGIGVAGSEHWVAISRDRDPESVRRFGCFTADLQEPIHPV